MTRKRSSIAPPIASAVVTGTSRGLGYALVEALTARQASVALIARDKRVHRRRSVTDTETNSRLPLLAKGPTSIGNREENRMWWLSAAANATTCDAARVEKLSMVLAETAPEQRLTLAASAWRDLCTDDHVLDVQFDQIASSNPASYWLVELQTSVLDTARWNKACPGGALALSMATKLSAGERRGYLWKACDLGSWSVFEAPEWQQANGLVVLPVFAAWTLTDGGISSDRAAPILRALSLGR